MTELYLELQKNTTIEISKQGLDARYNEASNKFLRKILEQVLLTRLDMELELDLGVLSVFQGIYLRDSTSSQLPACFSELFKGARGKSSKSGIKIEFAYDVKGDRMNLEFRNAASNDSSSKDMEIEAGSLYLQDLGYYNLSRFSNINEKGAYFINRYKYPTNLYKEKGDSKAQKRQDKKLEIKELLKEIEINEIRSKYLFLGMYERVPVRLIIQKVPPKVAEQRKRRLREENQRKGQTLSKERLQLCEYTLFITNIPLEMLEDKQIIQTYTIRWQIEILFKGWKSVMKFGIIHPMKPQRFLSMLYGYLIWIILMTKITGWFRNITWNTYKIQVSELKLFKLMRIYQNQFIQTIGCNNKNDLEKLISKIFKATLLFAEKEQKKNKPNRLFEIL